MSSINRVQFPGLDKGISQKVPASGGVEKGNSFAEVLSGKESGMSVGSAISAGLEKLDNSWKASFRTSRKMISSVPSQHRALFEAQISVSRVHFQTELVTKIGDSVQGTMKRLQQQGA
jgi:hypothetical protein